MAYSFNPFTGSLDDSGESSGIVDAPSDGGLYGRGTFDTGAVSLLLHMDGLSGSQNFIDSSLNNFTVTVGGDAQISTTEKRFGSGAGYFDGSGDYLEVAEKEPFDFGSGDFTIECWVYMPEGGGGTAIARWGDGNAFFFMVNTAEGIVVYLNGPNIPEVTGGVITPDQWHHVCLVRNGTDVKSFIDGQQVGTTATLANPINQVNSLLRIGWDMGVNTQFNGYIDEVRISKGVARYTENFAVPTEPFPNPTYSAFTPIWNTHTEDLINAESGPYLTLIINSDNTVTGVEGSIGDSAYHSDNTLLGLQLGHNVTSIGSYAFYQCTGFTGSLTIPNSVTSIGNYAFKDCTGFNGSLTIGNNVTNIGSNAFRYCTNFTGSLTIPNSVITIGNNAFQDCTGFTGSLTIPGTTSIGSYAFSYCNFNGLNVTGTSINADQFGLAGYVSGSLNIANTVTSIGNYAFNQCSGLTGSLTIPNSVTSIGEGAFSSCSGFTSLTLNEGLEVIGTSAFDGLTNVSGNLIIPNSVITIGSYAFNYNTFNGPLTIPNSVTTIGDGAFRSCTNITNAYLNQPLTAIDTDAFLNSGLTTVHLRPAPNTPAGWTIGAAQTIGGKSGVTVVADWTEYPVGTCSDATAQVFMTGWVSGDRTLSPIGYAPYGKETYTYGDEVVRYETGVWLYSNSGLGEITRTYSYADRPWLATWDSPFTSSKICP